MDHGLFQQAHSISDTINEVRAVLAESDDPPLDKSHPERCFSTLNGQPIAYSTSSTLGLTFRRHLLETARTGMNDAYEQILDGTLRK